jgi:ABC-type transport system substrate-binding protein
LAVSLVVSGVLVAGCGDSGSGGGAEPAAATPQHGGQVNYGLSLDMDGFNPSTDQWNASAINVGKAIYDPIVVLNPGGKPEPYLVESFESNDDFTEWTFTIRAGIEWHNGDPFTAADLATHLKNQQLGPLTSFAFAPITAVGVVDEAARPQLEAGEITQEEYDLLSRQVVVFMEEPWSSFPAFLTGFQSAFVAHPDYESGKIEEPIGTGPFKFDEWVPSDHVSVVRNDDYWRPDLPYLDELDFKILSDPQTRKNALDSGEIDMFNAEDLGLVPELGTDDAFQQDYQLIADSSDGDEANVLLNTQSGPFADVDLRRALALATDRAALNEGLYGGYYELADAPFREDSPWYSDPGWPQTDVDAAKELVEEWEDENGPLAIELTVLQSSDFLELGQALAAQWGEAGIETTVETIDVTAAGTTLALGNFEAMLYTFFFGSDPDEHYPFWEPDPANIGGPGELSINFSRYTSDIHDRVLHGARQTSDPAERAELYGELWKEFADQVPYVWLFHIDWIVVASNDIRGLDSFTTPDGKAAAPLIWGSIFLTEAWVDS